MKKLLFVIVISLISTFAFSQSKTPRSTDGITVEDSRLYTKYNFGLPRYQDTIDANFHLGIDSCGTMIFTRSNNKIWKRLCYPKKWEEVGGVVIASETDPVWSAALPSYRTKLQNDALYYPLVGNPSGFLTSFTEVDPIWTGVASSYRTKSQNDILYSALLHTHVASDIVSGLLSSDRLGSGTADATTYLKGNGTWGTMPTDLGDFSNSPGYTNNIGTVTDVNIDVTTGDALSVSGGPVTGSGVIHLDWQGDNTHYIDGTGNKVKFPTALSSFANDLGYIGSSFFTGSTSDYVRGDGSITAFPSIPFITPSALSRINDTNITLTLGGTPATSLLQAVSLTLGWTGTLADSRIASAATWNAKQNAITTGTTAQYFRGDLSLATFPTNLSSFTNGPGYLTIIDTTNISNFSTKVRSLFSSTAPITYSNGLFGITQATTSANGYLSSTDWNTFNGKQAALSGTGFVKITGTTISYDNNNYLTTAAATSMYQPVNSNLTNIAGLTPTTDNFLVSASSAWASRTPAQVKTTLSLNNVDNTSDANKPVSTAQQTALNLKATLASPTFTGTVTLPASQVVNGVTLTTSGSSTAFLNGAGTYTTPSSGSGTVTSVSVTTANGVSGSVATSTSTPAITLTLGAITPSSVAATGTVTGSNISGTNTGDQTSVSGNAGTATALATGRTISGTGDATFTTTAFDGTANVSGAVTVAKINGTSLAGLATGLLKNTTTTGIPSIAIPGTDYAPATSGTSILKGNGSGGFSNAGASDLPTAIDAAKINTGVVSNTEYNYLDGVTSAIQTQFDKKTGSVYLISDFTTSSTNAVNTNLTFSIAANESYTITITGTASKATSATGLKLAITGPSGMAVKGFQTGGASSSSTAMTNSIITSNGSLNGTFATGIGVEVPFAIYVTVLNSTNAGSVTLQAATVTSNVATIYAGTKMEYHLATGL